MMILEIKYRVKLLIGLLFRALFFWLKKDEQLVLFSAWFGKKYADSSRYMFEYCTNNRSFKCFWYTRDKEVYKSLKEEGKPVIYAKSLCSIYYQLRAKMLVSSVQLADFAPYFLNKCIYLDLGHGLPIKESGFEQSDVSSGYIRYNMSLRKHIDYYMCTTSSWCGEIIARAFRMDYEHLVLCNLARTDVLFDSRLREGKNQIVNRIAKGRRVIVYMPTHRSTGKKKMPMQEILDLKSIQRICEQANCVFLIKKHFYHKEEIECLDEYNNIFDITNEEIDSETITYQADIMVSDYSASYIEFLLLDRPVLFYAYDLEEYLKNERGMYLKFEDINAGYKARNKEEFNYYLSLLTSLWEDTEHALERRKLRDQYFDKGFTIGNARKETYFIMKQLIEGKKIQRNRGHIS